MNLNRRVQERHVNTASKEEKEAFKKKTGKILMGT